MAKNAIPGNFYYGADCHRCGHFIPMIVDDQHGEGIELKPKVGLQKDACGSCGHRDSYWAHELRRDRAGPATS